MKDYVQVIYLGKWFRGDVWGYRRNVLGSWGVSYYCGSSQGDQVEFALEISVADLEVWNVYLLSHLRLGKDFWREGHFPEPSGFTRRLGWDGRWLYLVLLRGNQQTHLERAGCHSNLSAQKSPKNVRQGWKDVWHYVGKFQNNTRSKTASVNNKITKQHIFSLYMCSHALHNAIWWIRDAP